MDPSRDEASTNQTPIRPQVALSILTHRLEDLNANLERVREEIKAAIFNNEFLPLFLHPKLLQGWKITQIDRAKKNNIIKQIEHCRKAMIPCTASIALGRGLPNELADMIQSFIGREEPTIEAWEKKEICVLAVRELNKRIIRNTETTKMEVEMKRLYEVVPLANVEVILAHFEKMIRVSATAMAVQ